MISTFADALGYERFMGRWSRALGHELVRFADLPEGARVLDVGCGTGCLTDAVLADAHPAEVVGVDPSPSFVVYTRERVKDARARFETGDARDLPFRDGTFDCAAAMLVLNFVPEPERAAAEMRRVTRAGGRLAACVWDYGGGMTMLNRFWEAAVAVDPAAATLVEDRMVLSREGDLAALWRAAGLEDVRDGALTIETRFESFRDYWEPFLIGIGPAGGYATSLAPEQQRALAQRLQATLWEDRPDQPRAFPALAWAVRGTVPGAAG